MWRVDFRPKTHKNTIMFTYQIGDQTFTTIREDDNYTFSDYFRAGMVAEDAVRFHGYNYEQGRLSLPKAAVSQQAVDRLQQTLDDILPHITWSTETARREFMIAPILTQVVRMTQAKIRCEHPLKVNNLLHGTLDYWIRNDEEVVVIEAKKGDLTLGFTQLAVELIAIDQSTESSQPVILGAVSVGDAWRFGVLDRARKLVTHGVRNYNIPDQMGDVIGILAAALGAPPEAAD